MNTSVTEIKTEPRSLEEWTAMLRDQEMPIFSNTVRSINNIIDDDKKGVMELASVILQDPNLTAQLLKLSNSIYYNASRQKMATVSRAIVMLGTEVLCELTLACSFFEAILSPTNKRRANEEIAQAIHAAVHAKAIAIAANDRSPEEVFIATLLHNIGGISFWCFCGAKGDLIQALVKNGSTQEAAEKQVLGFKLVDLGNSLNKAWNLGGLIEEANKKDQGVISPRVGLVRLGYEVIEALREGPDSKQYGTCLEKIAAVTKQPKQSVKETLQKNTKVAADIARHFGAHEASELIQKETGQPSEPETTTAATATDMKQLQFQILQDITSILSGKIDINLLLETVLEGIQRCIGMDRTIFALLTTDKLALREKVSLGWRKDSYTQKLVFNLAKTPPNLFFHALSNHDGYWLNPEQDGALFTAGDTKLVGKNPCFLMPVCAGDKPIGLIHCDRAYNHQALSEDDFKTFKHFVQQANIGLSLYQLQGREG